jgi:hypothetical protein
MPPFVPSRRPLKSPPNKNLNSLQLKAIVSTEVIVIKVSAIKVLEAIVLQNGVRIEHNYKKQFGNDDGTS